MYIERFIDMGWREFSIRENINENINEKKKKLYGEAAKYCKENSVSKNISMKKKTKKNKDRKTLPRK